MKNNSIALLNSIISKELDLLRILKYQIKENKNNADKLKKLEKAYKKTKKSLSKMEDTLDILIECQDKENNKNPKIDKKDDNIPNATYVESVDFKEIKGLNLDRTVGELPVDATLISKGRFQCYLRINKNKTITLKKGSIICIGNDKKLPDVPWVKLRNNLKDKGALCITKIDDAKTNKLLLKEDLMFGCKSELLRFVLGRKLTKADNSYSINVGNITLDRYLKVGLNKEQG